MSRLKTTGSLESTRFEIVVYQTVEGIVPFEGWLLKLRDRQAKVHVLRRIQRVAFGNLGDHRGLGDGLSELRIDHGPGYRVYYTQDGDTIVLLLCAGDKRTQKSDIQRAREYRADYERRKK
jgi:putative addiction module killer protein